MVLSKARKQKCGLNKLKESRTGDLFFQALQAHYGGEGNKSVRIKEAENLRTNLAYRN
jgi:hypothetical protein